MRGFGIVEVASIPAAEIGLAVELADATDIERMPDPTLAWSVLGMGVPLLRVAPFEASAHLKVLLALARGLPASDHSLSP